MGDPPAGGIFINYRREEASGIAGRLFDRLVDRYGTGQVFMDVSGIEPGTDFAEVIADAVGRCDVLLAIIGPRWLSTTTASGIRRLDDTGDFVRIEVEAALARRIWVIPVLTEGTRMPDSRELPGSMAALARREAIAVRHESFRDDIQRLFHELDRILGHPNPGGVPLSTGGRVGPADRGSVPATAPQFRPKSSVGTGGSPSRVRSRRNIAVVGASVAALLVLVAGFLLLRPSGAGSPSQGSPAATAAAGAGGTSSSPTSEAQGLREFNQHEYDSVIAGAPKADGGTVNANSWAKEIRERGTLKTGGSSTDALLSLKDPVSGKFTGFDAGLAQMLAQYIIGAPNIEVTPITVHDQETLIQRGAVDTVFATYSITADRAKEVAFAGPYLVSGAAIMVKSGNTAIRTITDLEGKTVATGPGMSSGVAVLQSKLPTDSLDVYDFDQDCVDAVRLGMADACVLDQVILISHAFDDPGVELVGAPFTVDPYGIGVTLTDPKAKDFVNAWLQKIYDDGSWAKLWKATLGTVMTGEAPAPPQIGSSNGT